MLIRIVRMTFEKEKTNDFLAIFEANKAKIRAFPGCTYLELHKDHHKDHVYITYSIWDDEAALNAYRHSDLFRGVWKATKALFSAKPIAYSHERVMVVD